MLHPLQIVTYFYAVNQNPLPLSEGCWEIAFAVGRITLTEPNLNTFTQ